MSRAARCEVSSSDLACSQIITQRDLNLMSFICTCLKRRPSFYVDYDDDDDDDDDDGDDKCYKQEKLADADYVRYITKH